MTSTIINKRRIKKKFVFNIFLSFLLLVLFFFLANKYAYNMIEKFSQKYDYLFNKIEIKGINHLTSNEIERYFLKYYDKSIFLLPLKNISHEIHMNKWIKSASLKSDFKNKVVVSIEESNPIGVFFNGTNYILIDNTGKIIDFVDEKNTFQYIKFFGENAKENFIDLITIIPFSLKSFIREAEYINKRRWDIILKNNIRIKLPEIDIKEAFLQFIEIYDSMSDRDKSIIDSFDLRIPNRAIIKFNE